MTSTTQAPARPPARSAALVLGALVLAALNLRPALASIGPLLASIRRDLGLSSAQAGLLTTIPTLCFGVFALSAARLGVRFGLERTIVAALALTGVATALRIAGQDVLVLFADTVLLGVGIAVAQALLPAVVKQRFPDTAVLVTGAYALSINAGALMAASLSAPVADALGSWPAALALWGLLAPAAVLAWLLVARRPAARAADAEAVATVAAVVAPARLPWRSRTAWRLTLMMAGASVIFIVTLTWLAPRYQDLGWSSGRAGLVLTAFTAMQILGGLIVPPLAYRARDRRAWLGGSLVAVAAGLVGVGLAPLAAPWLWAACVGIGMGGAFPLLLTLFVDFAATPEESSKLTAMGFFVGYLVAAGGPTAAGAIRDLSGSLGVSFVLLGAIGIAMAAATPRLRRR
jgi:CP family cyanate transporter-like MFS transporter